MRSSHTNQERQKHEMASSEWRPELFNALGKLFFVLAFIPVMMMIPHSSTEDVDALLALGKRCSAYGWTAFGLATLSGLFQALHKLTDRKHSKAVRSHG